MGMDRTTVNRDIGAQRDINMDRARILFEGLHRLETQMSLTSDSGAESYIFPNLQDPNPRF